MTIAQLARRFRDMFLGLSNLMLDSNCNIEGPTSCYRRTEVRLATAVATRLHRFLGMSHDIGHLVLRYISGKLL